jgi:hypothetical protein
MAFGRSGFAEVFALGALQCFHEDELEAMLCGVGEKWSVDKLAETIKCDHGCALHPSACASSCKRLLAASPCVRAGGTGCGTALVEGRERGCGTPCCLMLNAG